MHETKFYYKEQAYTGRSNEFCEYLLNKLDNFRWFNN